MNDFISLLIFTIPGLLTYFWIQLFGLTPTTKHQGTEVLALSALLWIPVVAIVMTIYQFVAFLSHIDNLYPIIDVPLLKRNWSYFNSLDDLEKLSKNIYFLIYYIISSLLVSYKIAQYISNKGYKLLLKKINGIRVKNGYAPLSENTTVWNETFLKNEGQIVEVCKLDKQDDGIIGSIKKVPRALEPEKDLVLTDIEHWTNIIKSYDVEVQDIFIDTKTSIVIKIFHTQQALEAQEKYNKSFL